jgi:hypothetical protein
MATKASFKSDAFEAIHTAVNRTCHSRAIDWTTAICRRDYLAAVRVDHMSISAGEVPSNGFPEPLR